MKKIFKKIFMIVTTILLVVTFTSFYKVNADINTTSDLVVVGAQVRTDEKSGIKFTAQSTFVPREDWGVREYGIVVMLGNYPIEEVYIGATNAFDARVSKTDDEGFFYLTIFNFPEAAYVKDITARAFMVLDDGLYVYGDTVTVRSLAKVSIGAKQLGTEGEFIDKVINHVSQNYVKKITLDNGNVMLDKPIYESNHITLAKEFIADWNTMFGTTLDATTAFVVEDNVYYNSPFRKSARNNSTIDPTYANITTFFRDSKMYDKWGWMLTYIQTELTDGLGYDECVIQIDCIINYNSSFEENWYYGFNIISYIMSIFNAKGTSAGAGRYRFENNPGKLGLIANYNNKIFADLTNAEFVKIGSTFEIPKANVGEDYIFNGWYLDSNKYAENDQIVVQDRSYVFVLNKSLKTVDVNVSFQRYATVDDAIADFLKDFNTYFKTSSSYTGVEYTPSTFYALGAWDQPIAQVSSFFYNSTYKAKWTWLVNYIAGVATTETNKKAFANFYNYTKQSELNAANSNYIYCVAYELRGWVGQAQYTRNSNFKSANYASASAKEQFEKALSPFYKYATLNDAIADFLNDYNTFRGTSHTAATFSALTASSEISGASVFLYNSAYKEKWSWLVNYIATVAGENNKKAFEVFYNYTKQSELNAANSNYIYCIAYELRGWVGQVKYVKNSNYETADYSNASIKAGSIALLVENNQFTYKDPTTLPVPLLSGYKFAGWKSSVDGSIITEYPGYSVNSGTIVYTAQWTTE